MGNNRDNSGLAFGIGLVAGGVLGYFLATDRGREMTKEAGERIRQVGDEVSQKAQEEIEKISGKMQEALVKGQDVAEQVGENLKEKNRKAAEGIDHIIDHAVGDFKKGMDKASGKLKAGPNKG